MSVPVVEHPLLAAFAVALLSVASWAIARRSWAEGSSLRRAVSLACRSLLLALLALALAGLQWRRERPEVAVAFAVDGSDSVRAASRRTRELVDAALLTTRGGDRSAFVQFGADALVDRSLSDDSAPPGLTSAPKRDGSDLAGALRLCRGLLPPDGRRRVVVLTDGATSGEDPAGPLRALREEGIDVVLVPLLASSEPEVLVEEVSAPPRAHEGEPFEVRVVLRASADAHGRLTVTRDGRVLGQADVPVSGTGPTAFRLVDRPEGAGTHVYRAHFDAEPDGFEQNDAAEAIVRVEGEPSILIIGPDPRALEPVATLLRAAGLRVDVATGAELPRTIAEAGAHSAVVLANVDSVEMSARQMEALRGYVREAGGGLLMTGGPESFGPGGWYQTPVEDVLPVDMDVRNTKYYPSLTLVLALDKSGSMSGSAGVSKMDLAKEAARQSAMLLQHGDRLGVIAFDSAAKWVVDPMVETSPGKAIELIGTIRAGGGTDIYPALVLAEEAMAAKKTALRHVILMSDGQSPPRDYQGIIERMKKSGVTTSAVAVGSDSDLATMQSFATWGGGRYYFTDDPGSIPRIFTKEAFTTARSFVVEERFVPRLARQHAVLRGATELPALLGYTATTAKPVAEVLLQTHREDPLLAVRSFGLGRSAALTTDLGERWAASWLDAGASRSLLVQLARWLSSRSESPLLEAALERRGGRSIVTVEARDESGGFLDFAQLEASVVGPDMEHHDVRLRQVAPGRYEADVPDEAVGPQAGAWYATIAQVAGGRVVRATSAASVFPYSDEYRTLQAPSDSLGRLALASGARIEPDATHAFDRSGPPARALRPAWRELLLLAAMLLLVDVGLRRVMLPEGWERSAKAWLAARRPARRATAASAGISRLKDVKAGALAGAEATPAATSGEAVPAAATPAPARPAASSSPAPVAPADREHADAEKAAFSSRLLAAKRRAKSEPKDGG